MTRYKEVLRLQSLSFNNSQIADYSGVSRPTVIKVLKTAKECGLSWEAVKDMTDAQISQTLFPDENEKPIYKMPDYSYIHRELGKSNVTLNLLWYEYCEQCRSTDGIPYQLTQFKKYYHDYVVTTKATMHINHRPGELLEVDWAGKTASIKNTDGGDPIKAYIFVAALPYSGYGYVEAFLSEDENSWIAAHVNAYQYIGGVTRILVSDNLKTGVTKSSKTEPAINKYYQDLAEHYGTAVIPARVKRPKDKSTVEGAVGILSTWILAAIRNDQFLSLAELNRSIREKLTEFNTKEFQKKEGSRASLFFEEKMFLLPLPARQYELSAWKVAKVQFNYHICVDHQNYSVPYEYIQQQVDVRLTKNMVEVYYEGNRICSHIRLYGRNNQYRTMDAHMPPNHLEYSKWDGERFKDWALSIGMQTYNVVEVFLTSSKVEQQGYKSCMALLKLPDKYSAGRLEAACERALFYTARPSLKNIQAILKTGQDKLPVDEPSAAESTNNNHGITRGADYYGREDL